MPRGRRGMSRGAVLSPCRLSQRSRCLRSPSSPSPRGEPALSLRAGVLGRGLEVPEVRMERGGGDGSEPGT